MRAGLERDVAGQNDHGNSAAGDSGSHRGLQRPGHLGRSRNQLAIVTAFPEQKFRMGFLEIIRADFAARNVRRNRQDWHTAAMAVEEPVDEVKVARTATPGTDRKLTGNVRVSAGGEGRDFLVTNVDPLNGFLPAHRIGYPIERIADYSIDSLHPAPGERSYQVFCYCRHNSLLQLAGPSIVRVLVGWMLHDAGDDQRFTVPMPRCTNQVAVHPSDKLERYFLGAYGFALAMVGAAAEEFGCHRGSQADGSLVALRLTLGKRVEMGELGGGEEHCGSVRTGGDARATADASGRIEGSIRVLLGDEDRICI